MYIVGVGASYFIDMVAGIVEQMYIDDNYQDIDYEVQRENLSKTFKNKHDKGKQKINFQTRKNSPIQGRNY